ncbi:MAG: SH3 domain-containing protein [Anaerolineae bacterium]|nr:SH3 domain-containing protein [Anaerolineae bacterium]
MRYFKATYFLLFTGVLLTGVLLLPGLSINAQTGPTATPAQIQLSTPITPTVPGLVITPPTTAPTTVAAVVLEAIDSANVRSQPDTDAAQIGTIRNGDLYPVIGRHFEWLQFQFPPSPNGAGWVFGQLVNVNGDLSQIPEINLDTEPTFDPMAGNATATQNAITQTPGGLLTATAFERFLAGSAGTIVPGQVLPTYTYPPNAALIAPTPDILLSPQQEIPQAVPSASADQGMPPILPILIVGGLGVLGLIVNALKRS